MSERPDWLPEPTTQRRRPIATRVLFGIVSLASLVLGVVGVALAGAAAFTAFHISGSDHRQRLAIAVMLWYGYRAAAVLAVALILRWVLWMERRRRLGRP